MESKNLDDSLKEAFTSMQRYVDLQVRYNKLLLAKRMGEVSSIFVLFMLLLGAFSFAALFLTFAFVDWFAANYGSQSVGNLIVFAFYLLLALILFIFREPFIYSPIRNLFTKIFANDDDKGEYSKGFKSKQAIVLQLKNYREMLHDEEVELKEKFEEVGSIFTLSNIIQSVGKGVYKTFVTTSNVAKITYTIVNKIKSNMARKKHRKSKQEPPQLEDNND
jgi:ABC-type multidrug transport system fused ATPase/permease subunit